MDELKIVKVEEEVKQVFEPLKAKDENLNPSLIKLQWLAERARKVERIKRELEAGTYQVDSTLLAKALLNITDE
ncbi:MAG: flagellar biosynthesis anti-sigma factor FlgM [Deltaproteobacteria bacterium]|nr:flagellar biosynthesis anti-sigma factor FlgM [Deltaproteobacteria bacterium]